MTTRLGAMIREQAGERLFERIEQVRLLSKAIRQKQDRAAIRAKRRLLSRLSLPEAHQVAHAFSLFFQLVNLCEERERIRHLRARAAPPQSLAWLFSNLRAARVAPEALARCLAALEVEPVLTAHPTEARRRTALSHLMRLARGPDWDLENPDFRARLDEILEVLWQTLEVRERPVTPLDEVDNVLFFFERTIFETVANFYRTFDAELAAAYPGIERTREFLTFASWIGGDRDGNPLVTPEVSLAAMQRQRALILDYYRRQCGLLVEELSHAHPLEWEPRPGRLESPPADSVQFSEGLRRRLHELGRRLGTPGLSAEEFVAQLESMREELGRRRAPRAAAGRLTRLVTQDRVFGFHLAELDFRDHHDRLHAHGGAAVLAELRALRRLQRRHSPAAAHRFILSMTRDADDLRRLLSLARRARLTEVDLVPLFETIDDLERCDAVMAELWQDRRYRAHLARRGDVQEVMLGYSDSTRTAATWRQLVSLPPAAPGRLADECGVRLRLSRQGRDHRPQRRSRPSHPARATFAARRPDPHHRAGRGGLSQFRSFLAQRNLGS
ncbi:phosphoenolpyruvate carboxylase [bacterium]|nr:phosphoenolpyruvate carboxylase [bacterium]